MAIKTTKKQLKEEAKNRLAFYCGGNVYTHENITYYINTLNTEALEKMAAQYKSISNALHDIICILDNDECDKTDKKSVSSQMICYSAGVYGNSGQLIQYTLFNETKGILKVFYTYYC